MEVEFKINDYEHREAMIIALAHSGYKVWVETKPIKEYQIDVDYYVCAEIPEKERREVFGGCGFDEQSV